MVNWKPMNEWVVVEREPHEGKTHGGILLPDKDPGKKSQTGRVIAVGPGRWCGELNARVPIDIKKGDTVLYLKFGGMDVTEGGAPVEHGGESVLFLRETDILAVLT